MKDLSKQPTGHGPEFPAYSQRVWKSAQSLLANVIWIMVSFGGR